MRSILKRQLTLIFSSLLISTAVLAAADSPIPMLSSTANKMIAKLQQNRARLEKNPELIYGMVDKIILPNVDTAAMARSALGREMWQRATPQQKQEFTQQFIKLVVRTYASALASYSDERIEFFPIRGGVGNRSRVQVHSRIIQRGGPPIPLSYRVVRRGPRWKIYDINVEGVSLIQSFRSQFRDEINHSGMDGLLKTLRRHNRGIS